jgi:hypothetical protein
MDDDVTLYLPECQEKNIGPQMSTDKRLIHPRSPVVLILLRLSCSALPVASTNFVPHPEAATTLHALLLWLHP